MNIKSGRIHKKYACSGAELNAPVHYFLFFFPPPLFFCPRHIPSPVYIEAVFTTAPFLQEEKTDEKRDIIKCHK